MKAWEKRNRQRQNEREFCSTPKALPCACGHDVDEHFDGMNIGRCLRPDCGCGQFVSEAANAPTNHFRDQAGAR